MPKKAAKTPTKTTSIDAVLADAARYEPLHPPSLISQNPEAAEYVAAYAEALKAGKVRWMPAKYISGLLKLRFNLDVGHDAVRRHLERKHGVKQRATDGEEK